MSQEENEKSYTWSTNSVQDIFEEKLSFQSPEFSTKVFSADCPFSDTSDEYFNVNWRLLITSEPELTENPENEKTGKQNQYISLFLRKVKETFLHIPILKVTFSIMHPVDGKKFSKYKILLDVIERQHYGFSDFISIYEFEKLNLSILLIKVKIEELKKDFSCYTPLLKNIISSDVVLRVGDKMYPGHKIILAMSSRFFQEKFGSQESVSYFLVEDTELEIFDFLLEYIYTGKVHNLEEQAFALFQAATKYEICDLISECVDVLIRDIKLENVISILLTCKKDSRNPKITKLICDCTKFIRNHFEDIMNLDLCTGLVKTEPRYLADILIDICTYKIIGFMPINEILSLTKNDVPRLCQCMYYENFFNNEAMKDVDIYVDGKKYFAHILVLAARSPVFCRMFSHTMKESLSGVIHIDDVEPDVFYEVLRFMYTNKFDESKNIAQKILVAANKYEIDDLKLLCECILEKKLEKLDAVDLMYLMTFAEDHNANKLKEKCLFYVLQKVCFDENINKYKVMIESVAKSHAHLLLELMEKLAWVKEVFN
ncbi:uncharacterized protein LOC117175418 isoform X2 [Belonocnema kinseyi]|nr:uncharacterized protein LOC117175418 isoform X2 [Belonocnema kinseyi]XP_033221151.1 uncharacterized protein LOC117175418 isoform X2 [Belonocnema kinseyi]XP_033221193.1 uncharacterized protein LOC117175418 isoform X2 [Belonocnema kinseyi]